MKSLLLAVLSGIAQAETLEPLFWTETDERFAASPFHQITVKIGDKMDLICPRFDDGLDHNNKMYHRIFEVSREAFQNCDSSKGKRLIDCNKPRQEKKYTVLFQDTNPSPYGLEFLPGETYYYISTSDGELDGINQGRGGGCQMKNMKLAISVEEAEEVIYEAVSEDSAYNEKLVNPDNQLEVVNIVEETVESVESEATPGSLLMGVGLGACGVLFLVLIIVLGYKLYRKRHPGPDKMLYMSPVDVSRVPLPPSSEVKLMPVTGQYHHQGSPPPPYCGYTTLVPCTTIPSGSDGDFVYHSDHSTNQSYVTRDSYTIHPGDVCEV